MARAWLQDHQPCTTQQYFESVAPIMPKHIRRSGIMRKVPQIALAKEALKVLVMRGSVCISDDICTITHSDAKQGQGRLWREIATASVNLREAVQEHDLTQNQADAFRQWLRTHGYCTNGKGVYTKQESTTQ